MRPHRILHGHVVDIFDLHLSIPIRLLVRLQLPPDHLLVQFEIRVEGLNLADALEIARLLPGRIEILIKLGVVQKPSRGQTRQSQIVRGATHAMLVGQNMDPVQTRQSTRWRQTLDN